MITGLKEGMVGIGCGAFGRLVLKSGSSSLRGPASIIYGGIPTCCGFWRQLRGFTNRREGHRESRCRRVRPSRRSIDKSLFQRFLEQNRCTRSAGLDCPFTCSCPAVNTPAPGDPCNPLSRIGTNPSRQICSYAFQSILESGALTQLT
jgi:hypothetical protein